MQAGQKRRKCKQVKNSELRTPNNLISLPQRIRLYEYSLLRFFTKMYPIYRNAYENEKCHHVLLRHKQGSS